MTNIEKETAKISLYMIDKFNKFPKIFEKENLFETYNYLESIAIPSDCECTAVIDKIPCWKCITCSFDEHAIYCSKCFLKSKDYHKDHKVYILPNTGGMCDCGDPNALKYYCPDHKGPFTEQKQIDEFIEKSFPSNILQKLKIYFDDLFLQMSKYLILTEQCTFFSVEILESYIRNETEGEDISLLKENFCIIFQNFMNFLYIIKNKNIGMTYLV